MGLARCIAAAGVLHAAPVISGTSPTTEQGVAAGNEVCPVSGEVIGKETNITYTYKGKVYRFCCPACVDEFKKNPEKYIDKMKKQESGKTK